MSVFKKLFGKYFCQHVAIIFVFTIFSTLLIMASSEAAYGKEKATAEIALYQGSDREKLLIAGAKKEGKLTYYNVNTWMNNVVTKEFEKKYPFIKVLSWRNRGANILKRVIEEYKAGRFLVDVISTTPPTNSIIHREGIYHEYDSPELKFFGDELKTKGEIGAYYLADFELYIGMAFNTELISPGEAPKNYQDLLDHRWRGKMSIAGSGTGIKWIGNALDVAGSEFIEKLGRQEVNVQNISGAALATLIVAGEVPLSPTIYFSNIFVARRKGAPVEWRPLEPVIASDAYSGISNRAPHPHAATLFMDYVHSKEGQKVIMDGGLGSPRRDVGSLEQSFKKVYLNIKYSPEAYEHNFNKWEALMKRYFIKKRQ